MNVPDLQKQWGHNRKQLYWKESAIQSSHVKQCAVNSQV